MKRSRSGLLAVAMLSLSVASCAPATPDTRLVLHGAGSTFAAPLFKKWTDEYQAIDSAVLIDYDSVGSGEGQARFVDGAVDFGVSEVILSADQVQTVKRGALLVPLAAGVIVLAYSPQEIPDGLKLPRDVYVDIFLGKINAWDDPRIVAANPGVSIPNRQIQRIVRRDSSGATYAFTSHLSAISDAWRNGPGVGKIVKWPHEYEKEPGNERVAGSIQKGSGAIGYVEYGAARAAGLHIARLENKRGEYIKPSSDSARLALASVGSQPDRLVALHDPDASGVYPIVTCTWLMVYKHYGDQKRAEAMKRFVRWGLTDGQKYCESLGLAPLSTENVFNALKIIDQVGP